MRQDCIVSPLLYSMNKDTLKKEVKMGLGRMGVKFLEEDADDLVLCGESEEDLKAMLGHFVEVCMRRGLKANVNKSKVMMLGGENGLECEVYVDGIRLENVSEFKYLGCVLDE